MAHKEIRLSGPSHAYLSASLLPGPETETHNRKLLILDLNGCLLYRTPPMTDALGHRRRIVYPRPYMPTLCRYLFHPQTRAWLDTMVWSSAQPRNVAEMVEACFGEDKAGLVDVWTRDKMGLTVRGYNQKTSTVKNMERVWAELPTPERHSLFTTVLFDDSFSKAALQPYNHVPVEEYSQAMREYDVRIQSAHPTTSSQDTYDRTLLAAIGILEALKSENNIANWIRCGGLLRSKERIDAGQRWYQVPEIRDYWVKSGTRVLEDLGVPIVAGVS